MSADEKNKSHGPSAADTPGDLATGKRIRAKRTALGWTRKELSSRYPVSEALLRMIEEGRTSPAETMAELEAYLDAQAPR